MSSHKSIIFKRLFDRGAGNESFVPNNTCGLGNKVLFLQNCGYSNLLGAEVNDN